ncbi:MAG: AraC family transcriptional regulator [Lewinellaceae bacterium]|nr:AraC family transcriptional regulator [Lewinellaceae bacterium]
MKFITENFPIPADLKPYLGSIWYFEAEGPETEISPVQYCLPTGMIELIIHVKPPLHSVKWRGQWTVFPEAFIAGVQTEHVAWWAPGGTTIMGIHIKPEAFMKLFGHPAGELAENYADVSQFLGSELDGFIEQLKSNPQPYNIFRESVQYFRHRAKLADSRKEQRPYFPEAMEHIRVATGAQSIEDLAGKVFVGKRQLQRAFQEHLGISPKTYGRIIRFKSAYDFVQQFPQASWVDVTYQFGYSDQSHFIRDFKEFTGENPTSFMSAYTPQQDTPFALNI